MDSGITKNSVKSVSINEITYNIVNSLKNSKDYSRMSFHIKTDDTVSNLNCKNPIKILSKIVTIIKSIREDYASGKISINLTPIGDESEQKVKFSIIHTSSIPLNVNKQLSYSFETITD